MSPSGRIPRTSLELDAGIIHQLKTQFCIDEDGCWIWVGLYYANGYPRLSRHLARSRFHSRAHIASYQLNIGEVPQGFYVCHECDKKGCINPKCLWLGTNQDNQVDNILKGKGSAVTYWTIERRKTKSQENMGPGNPMYGKPGTCLGRCGSKHPMFGKHHTEDAKLKISIGVRNAKGAR
jgi:hypothetical protein